jgi:hypothetical protein
MSPNDSLTTQPVTVRVFFGTLSDPHPDIGENRAIDLGAATSWEKQRAGCPVFEPTVLEVCY